MKDYLQVKIISGFFEVHILLITHAPNNSILKMSAMGL
jgi:hypothetical protein